MAAGKPGAVQLIAMLITKREAAGLTQAQLADALGEYQSFVARLESGQRCVDVIEFNKFSESLNFDPETVIQMPNLNL